MILPALSIRQPWAWLIANGFKDIENRSWRTKFRGPFYIHASAGMTKAEWDSVWQYVDELGEFGHLKSPIRLPAFPMQDQRGGIVGQAEIVDCVSESESPWFFGKYGFVIKNAKPLKFEPAKGRLQFFPCDYSAGPEKST